MLDEFIVVFDRQDNMIIIGPDKKEIEAEEFLQQVVATNQLHIKALQNAKTYIERHTNTSDPDDPVLTGTMKLINEALHEA